MPDSTCVDLSDWIAQQASPFILAESSEFEHALDRVLATLNPSLQLLGFGEPTHGSEATLQLRNRMFRHLVAAHGFTAIAIESSFPRGRLVDEFISPGGATNSYDSVANSGFSHEFGKYRAMRELIDWMRNENVARGSEHRLRFYGFDAPTEATMTDSPRELIEYVLDYLAVSIARRTRIAALLGDDAPWENPAAMMNAGKSIGRSDAAIALRAEVEELFTELLRSRPQSMARDALGYMQAEQHAINARMLLSYHSTLADPELSAVERISRGMGIRDAIMAENLIYARQCEQLRNDGRGKLFVFAHNYHLKRSPAVWHLSPDLPAEWSPCGAHLHQLIGADYAVIGGAMETSSKQRDETDRSLEGSLIAIAPADCDGGAIIPTAAARSLDGSSIAPRPQESPGYFPFDANSLTDFDALLVARFSD